MICETIFSLAENYPHPYRSGLISKETQKGIRYWIDSIYDNEWKKQQDEWIIVGGLLEMYLEGLNFLVAPQLLWPWDEKNTNLWRECIPKTIPDHYIVLTGSVLGWCGDNPFEGEDPGYHSNAQGQEIIADKYLQRITKDFSAVL
jgi:hypothetical protein